MRALGTGAGIQRAPPAGPAASPGYKMFSYYTRRVGKLQAVTADFVFSCAIPCRFRKSLPTRRGKDAAIRSARSGKALCRFLPPEGEGNSAMLFRFNRIRPLMAEGLRKMAKSPCDSPHPMSLRAREVPHPSEPSLPRLPGGIRHRAEAVSGKAEAGKSPPDAQGDGCAHFPDRGLPRLRGPARIFKSLPKKPGRFADRLQKERKRKIKQPLFPLPKGEETKAINEVRGIIPRIPSHILCAGSVCGICPG